MKNTFKRLRLVKPGILLISICFFFSLNIVNNPSVQGQQVKGFHVVIKDKSGERMGIYKESHALLIGVSDYTAGWPDLESVPHELKEVENILKTHGFRVEMRIDPNGRELKRAFETFIDKFGYDRENRLLFFFSGHGHTRNSGTKGYLVPTDAPNPDLDEIGFMKKALPMSQILAWSRQMESRHALFLFDSCFSGTVFKAKPLPRMPPHITRITLLPARQYITAGSSGETAPAKSVFTPAFVDALKYYMGDLNGDGYVSGMELGLYLQQKVPQRTAQTPQYGKIRDYDLSRGDFVFLLTSNKAPQSSTFSKEKRIALVIGNGAYISSPLRNPANDAKDMAQALEDLDFEVDHRENVGNRIMEEAIRKFGKIIREGGVGLFYFSGHGMQVNGRNYLLPVDAEIESESDIRYEAVDAGRVLGKMEDAGNSLNIVILDACRDNPFSRNFRTRTKGLARMYAPTGSLIAYATSPGSVAADGEGRNGTYTKHLLRNLRIPGVKIEELLKRVRVDVMHETSKKQIPWEASSLTGDFYFNREKIPSVTVSPVLVVDKLFPAATLTVEGNVSGATVSMDGRTIGRAPLSSVEISPGEHEIIVKKDGYEPYRRRIRLEVGRSMALVVDLVESAPPKSRLYVTTYPTDARIRILNIIPPFYQGMELNPGRYHVEVSAPGYEKALKWVELPAGVDKALDIRLKKEKQTGDVTNSLGMSFNYIKPGVFMMGSPPGESGRDKDEKPHQVTLTRGFYMQTTEVTQGQWKALMGANPSNFKKCGDDCPVEMVSWKDVQAFIKKLNRLEDSRNYRLPTEAEWEYAARAGTETRFSWGDEASCDKMMYENDVGAAEDNCVSYVRSRGLTPDSTAPVKSYPPNRWGLYDMHGNVWEWCQNRYRPYSSDSVVDPKGPSSGSERVLRGGSWFVSARVCRSAYRLRNMPGFRFHGFGFRLAFSPGQ